MNLDFSKRLYRRIAQLHKSREFPYSKYNRKNNCIFIHIPKVAGTSVLASVAGEKATRNHLPWYVYYTANPYFYNNSFKFSFVRNPWDRAVSAYRYLESGGNKTSDLDASKMLSKYNDFDDFVINGLGEGLFRNHLLFLPQSEFVVNGEQELAVDFVGRFENIDQDFTIVLERLGIGSSLAKTNVSDRSRDYRSYYKKEKTVDIILNIYKQDVSFFSYEF